MHNKAFNSLPAVAGIRRYAAHPLTRRYAARKSGVFYKLDGTTL